MSSAKRTPSGYSRPCTSALVWNGRLSSVRAIASPGGADSTSAAADFQESEYRKSPARAVLRGTLRDRPGVRRVRTYFMATTETIPTETIVVRAGPELDTAVGRAVAALDGLDLGGRRLAVMGANAADTLVAHLGALSAGVSSVPVARYLGVDEVAHILTDSGAGALLWAQGGEAAATEAAGRCGIPALPLAGWLADRPAPAGAAAGRPARPLLVYTSGTTGRPKGTEM